MKNKILVFLLGFILLLSSAYTKQEDRAVIPIDAKLEYNNALDMYKLGKYEEAIECLRTAIRLCPDYIDAYYNLGSILDYLNQTNEAVYIYKQIVARDSQQYEAAYKVVELSIRLNDKQCASEYVALIPSTSSYFLASKELMQKYNLVPPLKTDKDKIPQDSSVYLNITSPTGIVTDSDGNVYVASFSDNAIIKITPDNKRMIFFKSSVLNGPISIAMDSNKNMYIANYNANNVLKVSSAGRPVVFINNTPQPYSLHVTGNMLFVSCQGSNAVIRKKLD